MPTRRKSNADQFHRHQSRPRAVLDCCYQGPRGSASDGPFMLVVNRRSKRVNNRSTNLLGWPPLSLWAPLSR